MLMATQDQSQMPSGYMFQCDYCGKQEWTDGPFSGTQVFGTWIKTYRAGLSIITMIHNIFCSETCLIAHAQRQNVLVKKK
jgi:hypothetical protein